MARQPEAPAPLEAVIRRLEREVADIANILEIARIDDIGVMLLANAVAFGQHFAHITRPKAAQPSAPQPSPRKLPAHA